MTRVVPRPIWSLLQHAKATFITSVFQNRSVRHNYGGHTFEIHLHDPISARWYDRDWQRLAEIDVLATSRLRNGSTVFDIGAHQSVVAMMLAKEVGESGKVVAVEPNPFNVHVAKLNLASNAIKNVTVVQAMVSCSNGIGRVSFQLNAKPVDGPSGSWGRKVQSVTINQLASKFGMPDVVYLDVEGYEFEAVQAADDVLSQHTDWCIELHGDAVLRDFGSSNADIVKRFLNQRFTVLIIEDHSAPVKIESAAHVPTQRCHMIAVR
jgi:FkbM family methyltransferase